MASTWVICIVPLSLSLVAHVLRTQRPSKYNYCQILQVGPLWYVAQLTFNLSLAHTSVTSNTVISSTSSLFTFLISMWLLSEAFKSKKKWHALCSSSRVSMT